MSKMGISPSKTTPKDVESVNHKLLVQAGFVRQLMAGVYTYLPFGLSVLNKISDVVREEMNNIDGVEVLMPMLHPAEIWKKSGGWDHVEVLFKLNSRTKKEYALGQSQEEVVTPLMKEFIHSYKDLPQATYHIQWKFRDELRAKSGILRGREFLMKDMYSWHESQEDFEKYYEIVKRAYLKIFSRLGLTAKVTEASGGAFTEKISYEFEVLTDSGEANILYCETCEFCVNTDDFHTKAEGDLCPKCAGSKLRAGKAAEVGNVFDLGQKYPQAFEMTYVDRNGETKYPIMGCYGIGISRTMGVLVEKFHDDKGIVWPKNVAPYMVHLVDLQQMDKAQEVYDVLTKAGIEVLWDDRAGVTAGEKFADADLIGCPVRLVVSQRSLDKGGIEFKLRQETDSQIVSTEKVLNLLKNV